MSAQSGPNTTASEQTNSSRYMPPEREAVGNVGFDREEFALARIYWVLRQRARETRDQANSGQGDSPQKE